MSVLTLRPALAGQWPGWACVLGVVDVQVVRCGRVACSGTDRRRVAQIRPVPFAWLRLLVVTGCCLDWLWMGSMHLPVGL